MATNVTIVTNNASTNYTLSTGARGPAGPAGSNAVTSATTSDGTAALYLDSIRFESSNGGPTQLGEMAWESNDGSIDAQLENGVIAAIAEDGLIRVRNTSGVPIAKGDALRYTGTNGATGRLEVAKWVGANVTNAREFIGFAACAMENNSNGYAQWFGKLEDINTSGGGEAWTDGQIIYAVGGASATITDTAPTAAGEYVVAAAVINASAGTSGSMFVRPSFAKNIASADIGDRTFLGVTNPEKLLVTDPTGRLYVRLTSLTNDAFPESLTVDSGTLVWLDNADTNGVTLSRGTQTALQNIDFPDASGTLMLGSNNLSDLSSASTARTNLGLGTTDSPTFAGVTIPFPYYADFTDTFSGNAQKCRVSSSGVILRSDKIVSWSVNTNSSTADVSLTHGTVSNSLALGTGTGGSGGTLQLTNLTASGTVEAARMKQVTSSAADPTTTEYPTSGQWGIHKNTSSGDVFLAYNDGGSIKKVQLT